MCQANDGMGVELGEVARGQLRQGLCAMGGTLDVLRVWEKLGGFKAGSDMLIFMFQKDRSVCSLPMR